MVRYLLIDSMGKLDDSCERIWIARLKISIDVGKQGTNIQNHVCSWKSLATHIQMNGCNMIKDDYTTTILATCYSHIRQSPEIQQGYYLHIFFTLEYRWCDST